LNKNSFKSVHEKKGGGMASKKIVEVATMHEERLRWECIPRRRMKPDKKFSELSSSAILAHAHWLIDGIRKYVCSPDTMGKANRHLASMARRCPFSLLCTPVGLHHT